MAVRSRVVLTGVALLAGVSILAACSSGGGAGTARTTTAVVTPRVATSSATTGIAGTAGAGASAAPVTESNPAGDIPDTQAFVDYTPATHGTYVVKVPEGWARTNKATGSGGDSTLFSDKYNSIQIDTTAAPSAPTVLTGQAELTAIGSTATGFVPGTVTMEQRPAGSAVLMTYRADSAPNSVTGKVISQDIQRYEFWKDGNQVTLTLSAPVGSDNVDPWRTVTDSFRWVA